MLVLVVTLSLSIPLIMQFFLVVAPPLIVSQFSLREPSAAIVRVHTLKKSIAKRFDSEYNYFFGPALKNLSGRYEPNFLSRPYVGHYLDLSLPAGPIST